MARRPEQEKEEGAGEEQDKKKKKKEKKEKEEEKEEEENGPLATRQLRDGRSAWHGVAWRGQLGPVGLVRALIGISIAA